MSRFTRRAWLGAAGAGLLALPFARRIELAHAQTSGPPKRLIVFWTPNGAPQEAFWPSGSGTSFSLNTTMQPLEAHKNDLIVVKNITYSGTGDHKTGKPFSTTGYPTEDATTGKSTGPSIDQVVASVFGAPPIVVCGQSKGNVRGYVSYDTSNNKVDPTKDPKLAYETIFGPLPSVAAPPADPDAPPITVGRDDELHNMILETSIADVEALRARLPTAERVKMDDQLAALTALKKTLTGSGGGGGGGTPSAGCDDVRATLPAAIAAGAADYRQRVQQHLDLIVTSLACGVRQVASLMVGPVGHDNMGGDLSFLSGVGGDVHNNIAHPEPSGQRMIDITRHHAEQLSYLITKLKSVQEGAGTLFDNTVILWTTECTHGNHGHRNIPVVIAGSGGGALKTGQFLDYPENPGYNNLLLALMHAVGHQATSFGDSSSGPLRDLMA